MGRSEFALKVFEDMKGRGFRPDNRVYEALLHGLSYSGDADLCVKVKIVV